MKIKVKDLPNNGLTIAIQGDEAWLTPLYETFSRKNIEEKRVIKGSLQIRADNYGFAQISGQIRFEPLVTCSRCTDLIPWVIERDFEVEFRPAVKEFEKETDLNAEELDYYYLDEQSRIDLEELINDQVQTAFPSQLILKSEDGGSCLQCHVDITIPLVSTTEDDGAKNPFSILKNIKLDS